MLLKRREAWMSSVRRDFCRIWRCSATFCRLSFCRTLWEFGKFCEGSRNERLVYFPFWGEVLERIEFFPFFDAAKSQARCRKAQLWRFHRDKGRSQMKRKLPSFIRLTSKQAISSRDCLEKTFILNLSSTSPHPLPTPIKKKRKIVQIIF